MNRAMVIGTGSAVPRKLLTNADLEKLVETSDERIMSRTGIKERHIVSEGEHFSDLCTRAAATAPSTFTSGAWSPPIASTAIRTSASVS